MEGGQREDGKQTGMGQGALKQPEFLSSLGTHAHKEAYLQAPACGVGHLFV